MLNATFGNVVEMMITVNTLRATRRLGSFFFGGDAGIVGHGRYA